LETALLVSSGAAILVYVVGSAAGVKILRQLNSRPRMNFVLPLAALAISLVVLPFIGPVLVLSLVVVLLAVVYLSFAKRSV
jgi:uncharacterized membrane protein YoaK (UPF0700 family)